MSALSFIPVEKLSVLLANFRGNGFGGQKMQQENGNELARPSRRP